MAQHVHVGVPDEQMAVRALDGLRGDLPPILALSANSPYWLGENRFLAARDGLEARLVDEGSAGGRRTLRAALAELLEGGAATAGELGCSAELADAAALATDPGYARQRRFAARHGTRALLERLTVEFSRPARPVAAAWAG